MIEQIQDTSFLFLWLSFLIIVIVKSPAGITFEFAWKAINVIVLAASLLVFMCSTLISIWITE